MLKLVIQYIWPDEAVDVCIRCMWTSLVSYPALLMPAKFCSSRNLLVLIKGSKLDCFLQRNRTTEKVRICFLVRMVSADLSASHVCQRRQNHGTFRWCWSAPKWWAPPMISSSSGFAQSEWQDVFDENQLLQETKVQTRCCQPSSYQTLIHYTSWFKTLWKVRSCQSKNWGPSLKM